MKLLIYKKIFIYLILIILAVSFLIPIYGIIVNSFKSLEDLAKNPWAVPKKWNYNNYSYIWGRKTGGLYNYVLNSFKITIPTVIIVVVFSLMMAYPLARFNLKINNFLLALMVFLVTIPTQIMVIPIFRMINFLNLYDTIFGLVWVHSGFGIPFAVFLFRNYMIRIPREIEEAAMLDGANYLQILTKLIVPLCKPAIAVMIIFEFTWVFNEFLYGLVLTRSNAAPATVGVAVLRSASYAGRWDYQCGAALILTMPTLIVFLVFQKYFIKGIMLGSVKE